MVDQNIRDEATAQTRRPRKGSARPPNWTVVFHSGVSRRIGQEESPHACQQEKNQSRPCRPRVATTWPNLQPQSVNSRASELRIWNGHHGDKASTWNEGRINKPEHHRRPHRSVQSGVHGPWRDPRRLNLSSQTTEKREKRHGNKENNDQNEKKEETKVRPKKRTGIQ